MQKTILKQKLLNDIKNQANGFRFGEIWRLSAKSLGALVPILRDGEFDRDYVMIEELNKKDYELKDTGNISEIKIKNKINKSVFIRTGNMFEGQGTQSRASEFSVIIMPNKQKEEVIIPAKCVHASHGISEGSSFERYGYAPREVTKSLFSRSGQGQVWASVSRSSARLATLSGYTDGQFLMSDNMLNNLTQIKKNKSKISDIVKKVPCLEQQVGIIIFDEKGVSDIEVFDHPDSWKAFHENIIENYSDILSKEQEEALFELKKEAVPKTISAFIDNTTKTEESSVFKQNGTETIVLNSKEIVGEYTTLKEEIVHLLASRNDQEIRPESNLSSGFTQRLGVLSSTHTVNLPDPQERMTYRIRN